MKKKMTLFLTVLLILVTLTGCGTGSTNGSHVRADTLVVPGEIKGDVFYEDVSDAFRQSLWAFAGKTSASVMGAEPDQNSLYSPVSLYYALAMLEAGAAGRTKEDLRNFLEAGDQTKIGEELRSLYALMTVEGEGEAEQIANALWARKDLVGQDGAGVKQAWLDQMADHFYASAFAVDFTDPGTADRMSRWVEKETRGKIKPDMDISDPDLLLVLMNTVYFKADWLEPFPEESIKKDLFYGVEEALEQVPYLRGSFDSHSVLVTDRFTAGQLPLVNGHMRFVLPDEGLTPEDLLADPLFLASLSSQGWKRADLIIQLPKFSYRTKMDILKDMEALGLASMVQGAPNFSAMLDLDAEVSSITQETYIALDEKGVEAAGYTEIMMRETSALIEDEIETVYLILNRPFLYLITDEAGSPLFVGILRNPLGD